MVSPDYSLINAHLFHIAPLLIPQALKFQKGNKIDTKSDEKFLIIQATIESNRQDTD